MSIKLIKNLGGVWSRPFVTCGDPYNINGAIIGLNPATPIPTDYVSRKKFYRLIQNRPVFEPWYVEYRLDIADKKSPKSRSRDRLGLIIDGLPRVNFTETNVNAYPIEDGKKLEGSACEEDGADIAKTYLSQIQPKIVIIHHPKALAAIQKSDFFILGEKFHELDEFTKHHVDAHWNGDPTPTFSLPALASRSGGWSGEKIQEIVEKIRTVSDCDNLMSD